MQIPSGLQETWHVMTTVSGLSLMSVVFHVLAYVVFIFLSEREKTEYKPNPTAWLMFAYGTALVTLLEWDRHASWTVLALPVVCSILSLRVAMVCWKQGRMRWPSHWLDGTALTVDLILTVAYVAAAGIARLGVISEELRGGLVSAFLIITTAGSILPFIPQIRGVMEEPQKEHWAPWFLWTMAYIALTATTVREVGWFSVLVLYPAINVALQLAVLVLILVLPRPRARS